MDALDLLYAAVHRPQCARERAHLGATLALTPLTPLAPLAPLAPLGAPPEFWVETDAWAAPASLEHALWRVRRPGELLYTRSTLAAACADRALWAPSAYAWRGEWHADEEAAVCIAVASYPTGLAPVEARLVRRRAEPLGVRWAGVRGSEIVVPDLHELHPMHGSPRLPPASLDASLARLAETAHGSLHALRIMLVAPRDARAGCFFLWVLARAGERFASAATVRARACAVA
jgi:hypothetical protein